MAFKSLLLIASTVTVCRSIELKRLVVPEVAVAGTDVTITCDYDESQGSKLYSLKWYKDGLEMYRYVPANKQPGCAQSVNLPGVTVDCWSSSDREVVLTSVSQSTTGEFQCEIIGEHPDFRREVKSGMMSIVREPVLLPIIVGSNQSYRRFDSVNLNCSSTNREYEPLLTWKLNGKPARKRDLIRYSRRTLGLRLNSLSDYFEDGTLNVSCTASLDPLPHRTKSERLFAPDLRPQFFSKGGKLSLCGEMLLVTLLILHFATF